MRYSTIYTDLGRALIAKQNARGEDITGTQFLFAVLGAGTYNEDEPVATRTKLKSPQQTFPFGYIGVQGETNVELRFTATNLPVEIDLSPVAGYAGMATDAPTGPISAPYDITEIGVYAMDPDTGPILYEIALAEPGFRLDQMVPYEEAADNENNIHFNLYTFVTNAEAATIVGGLGAFVLVEDFLALTARVQTLESAYARSVLTTETTIPAECWTETETGAQVTIPAPQATTDYKPEVVVQDASAADAAVIGVNLVCETTDGGIIVYADSVPTDDIDVQVTITECTGELEIDWEDEE